MVDEKVEEVMKLLLPQIQSTIKNNVKSELAQQLPSLKKEVGDEVWDKAIALIGNQLNLPKELIGKLQQIDDLVKRNETSTSTVLGELAHRVEEFKDRLKGIDLNQTITMSYKDLQSVRVKAAGSWALISFMLGLFSGISMLLFFKG